MGTKSTDARCARPNSLHSRASPLPLLDCGPDLLHVAGIHPGLRSWRCVPRLHVHMYVLACGRPRSYSDKHRCTARLTLAFAVGCTVLNRRAQRLHRRVCVARPAEAHTVCRCEAAPALVARAAGAQWSDVPRPAWCPALGVTRPFIVLACNKLSFWKPQGITYHPQRRHSPRSGLPQAAGLSVPVRPLPTVVTRTWA